MINYIEVPAPAPAHKPKLTLAAARGNISKNKGGAAASQRSHRSSSSAPSKRSQPPARSFKKASKPDAVLQRVSEEGTRTTSSEAGPSTCSSDGAPPSLVLAIPIPAKERPVSSAERVAAMQRHALWREAYDRDERRRLSLEAAWASGRLQAPDETMEGLFHKVRMQFASYLPVFLSPPHSPSHSSLILLIAFLSLPRVTPPARSSTGSTAASSPANGPSSARRECRSCGRTQRASSRRRYGEEESSP